jgi:hypothetical protein
MSDKFEDCSATLAPLRIERRRQQLLREQEELARVERAEAAQLHRTRSRLDQVTTRIETLPPTRVTAQAALAHVLECMRTAPQRPIAAHGGWSAEELQAVAAVYSGTQADKVIAASARAGTLIDADTPSLEALASRAQSANDLDPRVATVERVARAMLKKKSLER